MRIFISATLLAFALIGASALTGVEVKAEDHGEDIARCNEDYRYALDFVRDLGLSPQDEQIYREAALHAKEACIHSWQGR